MGDGGDPALVGVTKEKIAAASNRLLHDCISLDAPTPEFIVRVGRERVERFDERYPHLVEVMLARFDPTTVYVHVSVPPDRSSSTVRCTLDRSVDDLCAELAENLQQLLIEGELWGAAWPPCPIHGTHPLWPEVIDGDAVWTCSRAPRFSVVIGELTVEL